MALRLLRCKGSGLSENKNTKQDEGSLHQGGSLFVGQRIDVSILDLTDRLDGGTLKGVLLLGRHELLIGAGNGL